MTEQEWVSCTDPKPMLEFLRGKVSDRALRLFACACCRQVWHLISEPVVRKAIEIAERYADWEASDEDIVAAHRDAATEEAGWHYGGGGVQLNTAAAAAAATASERYEVHWGDEEDDWYVLTAAATSSAAAASAWSVHFEAVTGYYDDEELRSLRQFVEAGRCYAEVYTRDTDFSDQEVGFLKVCRAEGQRQCDSLRDIFGNPFQPVTADPAWLTSTVVQLATGIYQERAFDRMPILADALQDAGCDNDDILNHCRSDGPHVRGCWVVDLLLGKE